MGILRAWRRRRILARARLDPGLWRSTCAALPFLRGLSAQELARLRKLSILFLAEKRIYGAAGLELTDAMRLSIAAQACLPVLNLGLDCYQGWTGIVVYPGEFRVHREVTDHDGVVHAGDEVLSGEAWSGGPVVLSWQDANAPRPGYSVVIHEFAHKLQMLGGDDEGYPAAPHGFTTSAWRDALERAYARFRAQARAGGTGIIDRYAAEDPAEFFAVTSEVFFTAPAILARDHTELYALLARFYRQDPAGMRPAGRTG